MTARTPGGWHHHELTRAVLLEYWNGTDGTGSEMAL
jgi:hypothetical protein